MSRSLGNVIESSSTASGGRESAVQGERDLVSHVALHRETGLGRLSVFSTRVPSTTLRWHGGSHWHGGLTSAARCLLVVTALFVSAVHADDTKDGVKKDSPKGPGKAGVAKFVAELKPEQEAAALAFAGEHHPELKTLVESLKSANPDGYKKALHDLARTQERLSKLQAGKPGAVNRYDHELALWKLDSRIRLTAARSAMTDTAELRAELKTLVEQRQVLSLDQLKVDREHTAARLAKIDEQLKVAEANPAQAVDAEVDRLLNSAKSKKPGVAANFKAEKQKKPGQGEGKPKGEFKPGEGKPKGDGQPGEGKPKGDAQPGDDANRKGEKQPSEPKPEPKTP